MLSLNWVDYLILAVFAFYAYEGYSSGFLASLLDLANFILSFLLGLKFYGLIAGILISKFALPQGISDAIGFFIVTFATEILIGILIKKFLNFEPDILKTLNRWSGTLPGVLSGIILISFILTLIVALPISAPIKRSISSSKIGNLLLTNSQGLEKSLNSVFGGVISETINFLTIEPKGDENVTLNFKTSNVFPDSAAEQYMFKLVNKERRSRGLGELVFDDQLRDVGRSHCKDMFARGYFSHYTPEGLSPFDRMEEAGIIYQEAGENLALSPNTDIAMQGLMNSPGHKANILSPDFGRIGVGVIDGGIYGEMFCQEFTD
ncbi:MAG: CvpA family protein [bacterium]|nr:CvpA family protein [bacterium]